MEDKRIMNGTRRMLGARMPRGLGLIVAFALVTVTPQPLPDTGPGPNGGTIVRWFIGLGTGGQPQHVAAEQKIAADFNAAQKEVFLSVEIYDLSLIHI